VTARELLRLSDLLLKLYESVDLDPEEERAVSMLRQLIYEKETGKI
jgi:hypothetical protein